MRFNLQKFIWKIHLLHEFYYILPIFAEFYRFHPLPKNFQKIQIGICKNQVPPSITLTLVGAFEESWARHVIQIRKYGSSITW